jgi:hypothetical protein
MYNKENIVAGETISSGWGNKIENQLFLTSNSLRLSVYWLNKDINGIFTEMDYKREDGTLFMKSVSSGGTSPNYTTRTETYYDADGTTVLQTLTYTITYDLDGDPISEVIS